ncbi:YkgJ family cysteine cluster protein [Desulfosediminicola sp.]|uniref:YkgJ family cysteine cluster protein n=1 Tax=Desulfosediminicola sp. TaxID=2886825 RepID=UPI003AF23830
MSYQKVFPEGMEPLGTTPFNFSCHPGVPCFTTCCKKVDLVLYPYDIICLKNRLQIDSEEFLQRYTALVKGSNPFFPTVMLALTEEGRGECPFLTDDGCAVYEDRPTDCRTYPLERAVDRNPEKGGVAEYYFLAKHDYCAGHEEQQLLTAREYIRSQKLDRHNTMNGLWAEIDTLFMQNPWKGEGAGGPGQQLAFLICYNIDGFRRMAEERNLFDQFKLPKSRRRSINSSDEELLKFGFDWLKMLFGGKSSLIRR